MHEGSLGRLLGTWVYGLSSFVSIACEVAVLVVVATVVKRHRPDAYRGLLFWAIGSVSFYAALNIARALVPLFTRSGGGIESYLLASSLLTVVGMAGHIALVVVFIRGLVALAQPPRPVNVEGTPPYR